MDINWGYYVLDALTVWPAELLFIFAVTKFVPLRSNVLFWIIRVAVLALYVRSALPVEVLAVASPIITLFVYILLPLIMSKGPLRRSVLGVVLSLVSLFAAELVATGIGVSLGIKTFDYAAISQYLPQFVLMHAFHFLFLAVILFCTYQVLLRIDREQTDPGQRFVMGFLVAQVLLLTLAMAISEYLYPDDPLLAYGLTALAIMCVVVDALLYVAYERFRQKQREDLRLQLLESQLDGYLAAYGSALESVEQVSKMRHDLRNHLQVISTLCAQGDFAAARSHLQTLRSRF